VARGKRLEFFEQTFAELSEGYYLASDLKVLSRPSMIKNLSI
jgi:hypothetical protein